MKITQLREREGMPALSTITLETLIEKIKNENKDKPVSTFRTQLKQVLPNERCYAAEKLLKILPAAEFQRAAGGQRMKAYNGIVELTVGPLSGQSEIKLVKQRAWELPQTRCAFVGASGQTVKIWTTFTRPDNSLPTTQQEAEWFHAHAYRLAVKCYQPQLPFDIRPKDPQLDQFSRLSYDPEMMYRPDSIPFYLAQPTAMPDERTYREAVLKEKSALERAGLGLNESDTIGLLFEAALRKAYDDLTEVKKKNEKGDENENEALSDSPEPLIVQLATNCFQSGIPQEEAIRHTLFHYYLSPHKVLIREIFGNAYRHQNGFSEKKSISKDQLMALQTDEFMKRRYEFRHNTQVGDVEYRERFSYRFRFNPVDKRALNSIALDAQAEGIPLWDKDVSRYVYSNRVPVFNPLEEFLYALPEWDGKERICALAQTVPCSNAHWSTLFHRWFLNMVAHWRGMDKKFANSVSPLLVGMQGTHKSTFCRNLIPPSERVYYTDSIDFSRKKDAELYLNRFALINIDEFDQISLTQQGFLKHILQKPVVNVRKPYANAVLEMRRYASFIATSNQKDLLTDPSGSRRFICIEVTGSIDTSQPINYDQLYAQAIHELNHGERYWFDQEEERIMMENNREFEQSSPEEQLFYRFFRPAKEQEEGEWLSPAEILEEIRKQSALPISIKRVSVFGRVLQKHDIRSKRVRRGTVYCVVRGN